jgi:hypothetical protein
MKASSFRSFRSVGFGLRHWHDPEMAGPLIIVYREMAGSLYEIFGDIAEIFGLGIVRG